MFNSSVFFLQFSGAVCVKIYLFKYTATDLLMQVNMGLAMTGKTVQKIPDSYHEPLSCQR